MSAAAAVRAEPCQLCGKQPGRPCTRRGDHLARWLTAHRAGAITREQLTAVIAELVVITTQQLVQERAA